MNGPPPVVADPSDAELIAGSGSDPELFGEIFDRHVDAIHGFFLRRVGPAVAEDLAAETFARAFAGRTNFVALHQSAGPWLYGIATNVIHHSRRGEKRRLLAYARADTLSSIPADPYEESDARLDAERLAPQIVDALLDLTPGDRDALLLFAWEQLSYAEVGIALGIPVGTVASRINRGRRRLRAALHMPDSPNDPTGAM